MQIAWRCRLLVSTRSHISAKQSCHTWLYRSYSVPPSSVASNIMGNRLRKHSRHLVPSPPSANTDAHSPVEINNRNNAEHAESVLSAPQKDLITGSWGRIKPNRRQFGQNAYFRVFQVDPYLKALFLWDDVPTQSLALNPGFQHQADMIMSVVSMCVRKIDRLEVQLHFHIKVVVQESIMFWPKFSKEMVVTKFKIVCSWSTKL